MYSFEREVITVKFDESIMNESFLDYIAEWEEEHLDDIAQAMLAGVDRRIRQEHEIYRYNAQMINVISHNDIRDHVAKRIKSLFKLDLIKIESKLVKSRIDILAIDKNQNYVGIEIKRNATYNEHKQFNRYYEEIRERYGPDSRLIVLASRYTPALLEVLNNNIDFSRYEIWWKYSKRKNAKKKYLIDELRVAKLEEDGGIYRRLFEDKIVKMKRDKEKRS